MYNKMQNVVMSISAFCVCKSSLLLLFRHWTSRHVVNMRVNCKQINSQMYIEICYVPKYIKKFNIREIEEKTIICPCLKSYLDWYHKHILVSRKDPGKFSSHRPSCRIQVQCRVYKSLPTDRIDPLYSVKTITKIYLQSQQRTQNV